MLFRSPLATLAVNPLSNVTWRDEATNPLTSEPAATFGPTTDCPRAIVGGHELSVSVAPEAAAVPVVVA